MLMGTTWHVVDTDIREEYEILLMLKGHVGTDLGNPGVEV
jgi:hypothetical protein